ncbi:hypothetical protein [Microbacterium arabinogalactanolyticum]|uniref:hypothetical protein n=1 Tax=Microbacterium arabinogalactanolyticum TaxID=69365 RepID=UPI002553CAD5|nr:hypothetical protein [Microbacterium arabinogalactanolyticum]GLC84513.1 hypothetical protein MIAR_11010 [Microbacterium arabinogalactanolyticum]
MTAVDWLKDYWLPVLVAVSAGLILSGFSKVARERFWAPVWHGIRWVGTLRITTTKRQANATKAVAKAEEDRDKRTAQLTAVWDALDVRPVREDSTLVVERIERLQGAADAAWKDAQAKIEAAQSFAEHQVSQAAKQHAKELNAAVASARAEGRQQALQLMKEEREATPLLRPVWRVIPLDGDVFVLNNTQSGVELSDVSIAAELGDFEFVGDTQWPGPSVGANKFRGERKRNGRLFGVRFTIRYRDAHGEWQVGEAWIDKEPRKAVIL